MNPTSNASIDIVSRVVRANDNKKMSDNRGRGGEGLFYSYLCSLMPMPTLQNPKVMTTPIPARRYAGRKPRTGRFRCRARGQSDGMERGLGSLVRDSVGRIGYLVLDRFIPPRGR